ncbi:unnamed protein product [Vitrella brassicaformis CCMP3155]|uniref:Uncharacterized protein n=1 Tax=Vitrella brassicaformis (strain CCMP3155) TaxID=1169540 RepID=A0A0G4F2H6_VITBC|nr:unnamed protein product [Vitrella brassicaformis CCMP3155]|eukprot:CEM05575.1 unnamed protein product [Vitrella brassicaformis CCMP3155]
MAASLCGYHPPALYNFRVGEDNGEWYPVRRLEGHTGGITRGRFSPDGKHLATASADGKIGIWDVETGQLVQMGGSERVSDCGLNDLCWHEGGRHVFAAGSDRSMVVLSMKSSRVAAALHDTHETACMTVAAPHLDNTWLLTGGYDERIKYWDLRRHGCLMDLKAHEGPVTSLDMSQDDRVFSSTSFDGFCRLWSTSLMRMLRTFAADDATPCCHGALSSNSQYLLSVTFDSKGRVWDLSRNRVQASLLDCPLGSSMRARMRRATDTPETLTRTLEQHQRNVQMVRREREAKAPELRRVMAPSVFGCFWRDRVLIPGHDGYVHMWDGFTGAKEGPPVRLRRGGKRPNYVPSRRMHKMFVSSVDCHPSHQTGIMISTGCGVDRSIVMWTYLVREEAARLGVDEDDAPAQNDTPSENNNNNNNVTIKKEDDLHHHQRQQQPQRPSPHIMEPSGPLPSPSLPPPGPPPAAPPPPVVPPAADDVMMVQEDSVSGDGDR